MKPDPPLGTWQRSSGASRGLGSGATRAETTKASPGKGNSWLVRGHYRLSLLGRPGVLPADPSSPVPGGTPIVGATHGAAASPEEGNGKASPTGGIRSRISSLKFVWVIPGLEFAARVNNEIGQGSRPPDMGR
jgi:hypothetical protein